MAGSAAASATSAWDMTKARLADTKFKKVSTTGTTVRGDSIDSINGVDETALFDTEKADIKPCAAAPLQ